MKKEKSAKELLSGIKMYEVKQKLSGIDIGTESKYYNDNKKLPEIPACIDGGFIELMKNNYALIRSTSKLNNQECYNILKLTICGRGWQNGRYDLSYSNETLIKFMEIADGKFWYLY